MRVGVLAPVLFVLFCFTGTYPRPSRWPPAWFLSMQVGVLALGWSVLFYLILFYFVLFLLVRIPVPPSGRLPASLYREAGGARVSIFLYWCCILFFTSHSV